MWGWVGFCAHPLITQCAFNSEIQSADIRKRLITCGGPCASPDLIYTHPVNSTASELGWSPDHYLTIHSAVSQSYLKKWPLLNLWLCSSSLVRSQTLERESSSAAVFMAAVPRQLCSTNMPSNLEELQQGDQQSRKWSVCIQKQDIWKITLNMAHLLFFYFFYFAADSANIEIQLSLEQVTATFSYYV